MGQGYKHNMFMCHNNGSIQVVLSESPEESTGKDQYGGGDEGWGGGEERSWGHYLIFFSFQVHT